MRRSIWLAVLVIALVLVAAGAWTGGWWVRIVAAAERGWALASSADWSQLETPGSVGVAASALVLLATAVAVPFACRRRDRFSDVLALAHQGRPMPGIARRTRTSQDAIRTLLQPGMTDGSRRRGGGRSCRGRRTERPASKPRRVRGVTGTHCDKTA